MPLQGVERLGVRRAPLQDLIGAVSGALEVAQPVLLQKRYLQRVGQAVVDVIGLGLAEFQQRRQLLPLGEVPQLQLQPVLGNPVVRVDLQQLFQRLDDSVDVLIRPLDDARELVEDDNLRQRVLEPLQLGLVEVDQALLIIDGAVDPDQLVIRCVVGRGDHRAAQVFDGQRRALAPLYHLRDPPVVQRLGLGWVGERQLLHQLQQLGVVLLLVVDANKLIGRSCLARILALLAARRLVAGEVHRVAVGDGGVVQTIQLVLEDPADLHQQPDLVGGIVGVVKLSLVQLEQLLLASCLLQDPAHGHERGLVRRGDVEHVEVGLECILLALELPLLHLGRMGQQVDAAPAVHGLIRVGLQDPHQVIPPLEQRVEPLERADREVVGGIQLEHLLMDCGGRGRVMELALPEEGQATEDLDLFFPIGHVVNLPLADLDEHLEVAEAGVDAAHAADGRTEAGDDRQRLAVGLDGGLGVVQLGLEISHLEGVGRLALEIREQRLLIGEQANQLLPPLAACRCGRACAGRGRAPGRA